MRVLVLLVGVLFVQPATAADLKSRCADISELVKNLEARQSGPVRAEVRLAGVDPIGTMLTMAQAIKELCSQQEKVR